jgi:hypothetical protein
MIHSTLEGNFQDLEDSMTGNQTYLLGLPNDSSDATNALGMFYVREPLLSSTIQYFVSSLSTDTNYLYWLPDSTTGGTDGLIDVDYTNRIAVDDDPQGLTAPLNMITYYLEAVSGDPTIEIMATNYQASAAVDPVPASLATITDSAFTGFGTPIDISCFRAYPDYTSATGNWVAVLEDNGDSTWQISMFDQSAGLIDRFTTALPGDPIALDCDYVNNQIHVWANNGTTLEYTVFGYAE